MDAQTQATNRLVKNAESIEAILWENPEGLTLKQIGEKAFISAGAVKEALKQLGANFAGGVYTIGEQYIDPFDTLPPNAVQIADGVFMMKPTDAPQPTHEPMQERLADGGWAFMAATTGERLGRVWPSATEAIEQMERETGQKLEEITAMNRAYLAKFKAVITYKPIFALVLGEV